MENPQDFGLIAALPETDAISLAYAAAVIDCEGSIGLYKSGDGVFRPIVQVANTDMRLLVWLKERFKGNLITPRGYIIGSKVVHRWAAQSRADVTRVLSSVLPFMLLKVRQAEIVLSSFAFKDALDYESLKGIAAEIKILNRKGNHG